MCLWNLRDGCHCRSGWFLNLSLQTLAQVAAEPVCSWTREEAERCYKKSASKEEGRDIYSLGSKGRMGIWRIICLENRNFFERWQSWLELISEQNKLLQHWGHMLTQFFDTCLGRWFGKRNVADLKKAKRCIGSESAEGVRPIARGIFHIDADPLILVIGWWKVADEIRKKEGSPNSTRILMIRL